MVLLLLDCSEYPDKVFKGGPTKRGQKREMYTPPRNVDVYFHAKIKKEDTCVMNVSINENNVVEDLRNLRYAYKLFTEKINIFNYTFFSGERYINIMTRKLNLTIRIDK